jgi:Domain of unknown function (DUF4114)
MKPYFLGDDVRRLLQTKDRLLQKAADASLALSFIAQVESAISTIASVTPVFISEFMLDELVATDPNTVEARMEIAEHGSAMYGDDYILDTDADCDEWRDRLDALRVKIVSELPPNAVELTLQDIFDVASTIAQPAVADRRRKWDIGGIPPWVWYLLVFPAGKGLLSSQVITLVNIAIADALINLNRSAFLALVQQTKGAAQHSAQPDSLDKSDSPDSEVNQRKLLTTELLSAQALFEPKDLPISDDEPEDGGDTLSNGGSRGRNPVAPNGRNPGSGDGTMADPGTTQDQANSPQTDRHSEPENRAQASGNFDRTNILNNNGSQLPQRWDVAALPQQEGTVPTTVLTTAASERSPSQSIAMLDRLINGFTTQPISLSAPNLDQSAWSSGRDVMLVAVLAGDGPNLLNGQDAGSNPVFTIGLTPIGQSSNPIAPLPVDAMPASPVNVTSKPDIGLAAVPIDRGSLGNIQPQPTLTDRTSPLPTPGHNPQIPGSQAIPGNSGTVQPPTKPAIEQPTTIDPGQNRPLPTQSFFQEGTFTVGSTGEITIDFLFDGGFYVGELAIFSTSGMEQLVNDPTAFIAEALRRSSSHSKLGDIVISDFTEGAKSSGHLGEPDFNQGAYRGPKTLSLTAGQQYGLMLIPNASLQDSERQINLGSDRAPIFSMFQTGNGNLFGQRLLAQIDSNTIGIEDIQSALSDRDYNDLVIRLDGASINATTIRDVIDPEHDWTRSGGTGSGSNGKTYPWSTTTLGDAPGGYQPAKPIASDSRSTDDWHRC